MSEAEKEREAIVAWHESRALEVPQIGFIWAIFHPRKSGERMAQFWTHVHAAKAIERLDHHKDSTK